MPLDNWQDIDPGLFSYEFLDKRADGSDTRGLQVRMAALASTRITDEVARQAAMRIVREAYREDSRLRALQIDLYDDRSPAESKQEPPVRITWGKNGRFAPAGYSDTETFEGYSFAYEWSTASLAERAAEAKKKEELVQAEDVAVAPVASEQETGKSDGERPAWPGLLGAGLGASIVVAGVLLAIRPRRRGSDT